MKANTRKRITREKKWKIRRDGEPKGEGKAVTSRERPVKGVERGLGRRKRSNMEELSSQGMSTRNGTRTRSRKEGRLSIRQIE